jgi:hypothetical protein
VPVGVLQTRFFGRNSSKSIFFKYVHISIVKFLCMKSVENFLREIVLDISSCMPSLNIFTRALRVHKLNFSAAKNEHRNIIF